jgi:hypothetical protein
LAAEVMAASLAWHRIGFAVFLALFADRLPL